MISEIFLFWGVLAGLLCLDNLVLLPAGTDYLRFNRRGRWIYEPGMRLQARHRDLIFLNPMDPFHRLAQTDSAIGSLTPQSLRAARQRFRSTLRNTNLLSLLGSGYLLVLAGLAVASIWLYFGDVLLILILAHLVTWVAAMSVLAANRENLYLSRFRTLSLAFESFVVPGYLVNLGKRVWFRQTFNLPAMTIGLRQLKSMPIDAARELYAMQMSSRLDELEIDFDIDTEQPRPVRECDANDPSADTMHKNDDQSTQGSPFPSEERREEIKHWFKEARKCLATSV
jgi:hypothetical protein